MFCLINGTFAKYETKRVWLLGQQENVNKDRNGFKYDLKSICFEETDFFQIVKNVMNLYCF